MSRESEIAKYSTAYQHPEYRMGDARRQALTSWLTTNRGVDRTYLDVGCGRGESLTIARDAGLRQPHGFEVVEHLCDGFDIRPMPGLHALPTGDASYDLVSCLDVLEHVTEADSLAGLRELVRVTRERLLLSVAWFPHVFRGVDLHINLHDAAWWEAAIRASAPGCEVNRLRFPHCSRMAAWFEVVKPAVRHPRRVLVAALGPSVEALLPHRDRLGTVVGVNDIEGRGIQAEHVIVIDEPEAFPEERRRIIAQTGGTLWARCHWPGRRYRKVTVHDCRRGPMDLDSDRFYAGFTTALPAIHLAYKLGATDIGVIGFDVTEDHATREHLASIKGYAGWLVNKLADRHGVRVHNLSRHSAVDSIPRLGLEEWLSR